MDNILDRVVVFLGINGPIGCFILKHMRFCLNDLLFMYGVSADSYGVARLQVRDILSSCYCSTDKLFKNALIHQSSERIGQKLVIPVVG